MKIGIIGASLSGLIAGDKLAKAGHDVTVIEKSRALGGRLATWQKSGIFFDYGVPFLTAESDEFRQFIQDLIQKKVLQKWSEYFRLYDGSKLYRMNPNRSKGEYFAGTKGLNAVAQYLKRWVDVKSEEAAGGLTHIGADRSSKRSWMINLTDISVFECDAVILATPASEAYGLLQTAQDETPARRIIRVIDEIQYEPRYVLMARYEEASPEWKGIECEDPELSWIGNEGSKGNNQQEASLVIHSSPGFVRHHYGKDEEEISQLLLEQAGQIAEPWLAHPVHRRLHFWKYYQAKNTIRDFFMEMEMKEAPLALIGDYFNGSSAEAAYLSGAYLADYWINKYEELAVNI